MEPTRLEPSLDCSVTHPDFEQLPPGHHPVLPFRPPRQRPIHGSPFVSPRWATYLVVFRGLAGHGPAKGREARNSPWGGV